MTMNPKIKQQEAAVEMMRSLVTAKRARPEKLEAAINELNRLKSELATGGQLSAVGTSPPAPSPQRRGGALAMAIMQDANSSVFEVKQGALSQEATLLRREQSELSNMLHKVPQEQACPELVDKILDLHHQIEGIWDQKKFLGRNQHDGPADPAHDQQVVERSVAAVESKAELSVKIQQLREKRSKLKKKLENPKATMESRTKWEIELAQVDAGIEEAGTKRALL
jgi:hypothetical protein